MKEEVITDTLNTGDIPAVIPTVTVTAIATVILRKSRLHQTALSHLRRTHHRPIARGPDRVPRGRALGDPAQAPRL